jgi:large subunit ribosomal protein L2
LENCRAVLGIVSNMNKREFALVKAGTARNKGKKPTVRGVAMNPVDHPHGGGEGKKSPKRCAMSP